MAKFYPLKVQNIEKDTRDAVVLTLEAKDDAKAAFKFVHGQYLTFKKEFEGEELRRSYSICSGINDNAIRVGIKKVNGGWFSTWANEELKVGDVVEAMPPMGRFTSDIEPRKGQHYLAFAIGSGITPMLSIIKTILECEPLSAFTLVYGNRAANSIMFREELDDLKNLYMERFSIVHILKNDAGDIDLFNGRIDADKCDRLFSSWIDISQIDLAFICGPEDMMFTVRDRLKAHGMDEKQIKFELFASSRPKKARAKTEKEMEGGQKVKATIIIDGSARQIDMPNQGESILEAALLNNIDIPFSCRAGVCSTCSAKVVEGEVEMITNYGLEDYEVDRGLVLTCQSYPLSDKVIIDYDQH